MAGAVCWLVYELSGMAVSERLFARYGRMTRLWLGLSLGLAMLMWFPSLFAFAMGFTVGANLLGTVLALLLGAGAFVLIPKEKAGRLHKIEPSVSLALAGSVPVFLVMTYMLYTHTLRPENGALWTGQATYGDMNLHLGIVTGLVNAAYPPEYTILPGTLLGYPFLTDAASSSLYIMGMPLRWAFMLPGVLMSALVPWGFVMLAWEMTRSKKAVLLACVLMFLNGGLGFAYIFDQVGRDPSRVYDLFYGFYRTPANLPEVNVRWVNVLADMMLPQRTLLGGWTMLVPALWLLLRSTREKDMRLFAALGVWAGAMPMIHTHSFMALGLLSAGVMASMLLRAKRSARIALFKGFLIYGALAVVLALPQLLTWTFPQTVNGGSLRLRFNWANNQGVLVDEYFWFWVKNVGLVFIIFVPAARFATKRQRAMALGALLIFMAAELFQFQPNEYDNNKLFYVAFMVMIPLAAQYLCALYDRLENFPGKRLLAVIFIAVSICSGTLSVVRECLSNYQLYPAAEVSAMAYVEEHTDRDAVFLTGQQHNNAVSTLTGRRIVCGTPTFLFFHGVDYSSQEQAVRLMYEYPAENLALFDQYHVSYIYISSTERYNYAVDEAAIAQLWPLVWDEGGVRIYAVKTDIENEQE